MDHIEERTEPSGDVVSEAIAYAKKAQELREAAIAQLLEKRAKIDQDLKTLGYSPNGNGVPLKALNESDADSLVVEQLHPHPRRFKDSTLAEVGRVLLDEHGVLHGKEIERLAKSGGFRGGTDNFQNYLPVAFKRAGGFENIGGNRWRGNKNIPPKR